MERHKSVVEYISAKPEWQKELNLIRDILLDTELEETVKWGAPCYTLNGKNVVGMMAFKNYAGMWFHNGVFLKDPAKVLVNAQEGVTKALRQWRFKSIDEMDAALIKEYVIEAIENQKAGKEMKPEKKKFDMPVELENILSSSAKAADMFAQFSASKQNEYKEHIGSAKQEKTRISRAEKALPLIENGIGLNDKYRK